MLYQRMVLGELSAIACNAKLCTLSYLRQDGTKQLHTSLWFIFKHDRQAGTA